MTNLRNLRPVPSVRRSLDDDDASEDGVKDVVAAVLRASRVLVGVAARSMAVVEDTVTPVQFRTLVVLDSNGSIKLNRLAELLGVNASTAVRMVDRLLAADLVTRTENPGNRREVLLGLTAAGRRIVRRVTARRRAEVTRIVTAIPSGQRAALIDALTAFAEAAGEPAIEADEAGQLDW